MSLILTLQMMSLAGLDDIANMNILESSSCMDGTLVKGGY